MCDKEYRDFHARLIPTVDKSTLLGLRSPHARAIARKYAGTPEGDRFLSSLPHSYYDENIVHAFILGNLRQDRATLENRIREFLPYVDNWAVCDGLCAHLKWFFKDRKRAFPFVDECLSSSATYTLRFGIVALLSYYLTEEYIDTVLKKAVSICSEEYYINMALAWLVSFCLIKHYERTLPILENCRLSPWVHNKSIQKAVESYQISEEKKAYLRSIKRK